jgi:phosphopantothenoylcysteine synthetase/decarboxylase
VSRVLHVVVCGAGVATNAYRLAQAGCAADWDVWVIPTPSAVEFVDIEQLSDITGHPVRARWRRPGEPGSLPAAQAAVVAPATYNTINKWAAGLADTYALGQLAEATGRGVPVAVLPFVNTALAANLVYAESLARLRASGVLVLDGTANADGVRRGVVPHPPKTGGDLAASFPWTDALDAIAAELSRRHH